MEFQKERVYSAVNADELKPGDKVIVANSIGYIKDCLREDDYVVDELTDVLGEFEQERFGVGEVIRYFSLAYLVERKENCTNCGCVHCWYRKKHRIDEQRLHTCSKRIEPKTEQKAEKQYRPFVNTDELVKVWDAKYKEKYGLGRIYKGLDMPYIWVRYKTNQCGQKGILITKYEKNYVQIEGDMIAMHALMADYEFLDGSPCGEEA